MAFTGRLFRTTEEQAEPIEACVTGKIPDFLNGCYIRVGPGIFDHKDFTVNHWCDGLGIVYKFEINKGKVYFSKKIIQSEAYKKLISVGKPVFTELGTKAYPDTNKNIFQKVVSNVIPELTDNVAANIFQLGDSVLLSTETCNLRRLNPKDLSSDKKVDLSSYVPLNRLCSHIYSDSDGTAYTIGSSFTNNFKCQVIKIPPNKSGDVCKKAHSICAIPNRQTKSSSYAHSFGLSERFVVFIEQPFFLNNLRLMTAHLKGKSLLDCMDWDPTESTRFILVNKVSGEISPIIYESESPFFFLHVVNTYEEDGEITIDIIAHDSPEIMDSLYLDKLRKNITELKDQATIRRFILPLAENIEKVAEGQNLIKNDKRISAKKEKSKIILKGSSLTDPNYDLPTINNKYFGKKYTYCYTTGLFGSSIYHACILKINVTTGDVITWNDGEGSIPGEAIFVQTPGSTTEDGGYLITGVTATKEGKKDFLLILDARDLTEVARGEVNAHVPHLIHAVFIPSMS